MFFPLYGVLVWWLVFRGRRRWSGLAWLALGEAVIAGIGIFHTQLGVWFGIQIESLQLLLYSYAGLLAVIGLFLFVQPRVYSIRGRRLCRSCGYDLVGILEDEPLCPECGDPYEDRASEDRRTREAVRRAQALKWGGPPMEPLRVGGVKSADEAYRRLSPASRARADR